MRYGYILFLLFICINAFGQQYHEYDTELVFTLEIGPEEHELGFQRALAAPTGFGFIDSNHIMISDPAKERNVIYDLNGNYIESVSNFLPYASSIQQGVGTYLYAYPERRQYVGVSAFDIETQLPIYEVAFLVENQRSMRIEPNSIIPFPQIVFFYDSNGSIHAIPNPGLDRSENQRNILGSEETHALFVENNPVLPEGLLIDERSRLFLNGNLITRNEDVFAHYWFELDNMHWRSDAHSAQSYSAANDFHLIGLDRDSNWYWYDGIARNILIYDVNGIVIDIFSINQRNLTTIPTLHPSGDIYTMYFDQEDYDSVTIYRITRRW